MAFGALSDRVLGAAREVHRRLGPGLLESAYAQCLAHELSRAGLAFERQHPLPLAYKDLRVDCGYRVDLLVEEALIVELESTAETETEPALEARLLTYLRLAGVGEGLLINFNVPVLKFGVRRVTA
ncbi:GxxExxY protein [Thiohalorhabdus methylotrophus]|uniref:GxxExxY protein n=1 Tax=Thiohalorhabdus methylotrophus TaxID=3242694 RepID=A0ABV4TX44_9GAMM